MFFYESIVFTGMELFVRFFDAFKILLLVAFLEIFFLVAGG
jgi:hypothetical protein